MADIQARMAKAFDDKIMESIFGDAGRADMNLSTTVAPEDAPTLTVKSLLENTLSAFTGMKVKIMDSVPEEVFAWTIDPMKLVIPPIDGDRRKLLILSEANAHKLLNAMSDRRKLDGPAPRDISPKPPTINHFFKMDAT